MGVYIKNMEMPKDCIVCPFGWNGCNKQHDFVYMGSRPDFCPLIDVHEPHGRLIDANVAYDKIAEAAGEGSGNYVDMDVVDIGLSEAPTIIETEG